MGGGSSATSLSDHLSGGRDITPLAGLVRLTRLQLSQSGVQQAAALCDLTALECLFLDRSPLIPDLTPLSRLTNLAHLAISTMHRSEVCPSHECIAVL